MARLPLTIREATSTDVEPLLRLWESLNSGIVAGSTPHDASEAIENVLANPSERLLVGDVDGRVVASAHYRRVPLSPLHLTEVVQISFLLVSDESRRHGYARVLLDAGVAWAEELGLDYVTAYTSAASRESNRFLARLGLASAATLRVAPTALLRAKLNPGQRMGGVAPGQVLAMRRSMRRRQTTP